MNVEIAKCQKCNHEWIKRTQNPLMCPHCQCKWWNHIDGKKNNPLVQI